MTTNESDRRIVLLTAGVGARLGTITEKRNKGLISINNKAILSYILERLPQDVPVVVALGYYGDLVRQYLEIAHPERMFIFKTIDPYEGPGSSSGCSLLSLRSLAPGPFIFCTNDTIVRQAIAFEGRNWAAIGISDDIEAYTRFSMFGDRVTRIHRKGELGGSIAYTGLAEIHDYDCFWASLESALVKHRECSDIEGLYGLLEPGLYAKMVDWIDTGTKDKYDKAIELLGGQGAHLPKEEEDIYFLGNRVIKVYSDSKKCQQRVTRARLLDGLVPKIVSTRENFYSYRWIEGEMLSKVLTPDLLLRFLAWAEDHLWQPVEQALAADLKQLAYNFYALKTLHRLDMMFNSGWIKDAEYIINGNPCQRPGVLIRLLDEHFFAGSKVVRFHGDLHPDNIILRSDGAGFTLLDWRENYAGELEFGDLHYDLAKLYHGLLVSHDFVKNNQFKVDINEYNINIDIAIHYRDLECIEVLERWAQDKDLSVKRLRIIVALIYLNNAPLHHYPYNQFLFFLGTRLLQRELGDSTSP